MDDLIFVRHRREKQRGVAGLNRSMSFGVSFVLKRFSVFEMKIFCCGSLQQSLSQHFQKFVSLTPFTVGAWVER